MIFLSNIIPWRSCTIACSNILYFSPSCTSDVVPVYSVTLLFQGVCPVSVLLLLQVVLHTPLLIIPSLNSLPLIPLLGSIQHLFTYFIVVSRGTLHPESHSFLLGEFDVEARSSIQFTAPLVSTQFLHGPKSHNKQTNKRTNEPPRATDKTHQTVLFSKKSGPNNLRSVCVLTIQ